MWWLVTFLKWLSFGFSKGLRKSISFFGMNQALSRPLLPTCTEYWNLSAPSLSCCCLWSNVNVAYAFGCVFFCTVTPPIVVMRAPAGMNVFAVRYLSTLYEPVRDCYWTQNSVSKIGTSLLHPWLFFPGRVSGNSCLASLGSLPLAKILLLLISSSHTRLPIRRWWNGVDGYTASLFVTTDLEVSAFSDVYPNCSDFQTKYGALQQHVGSDKHPTFPDYTILNGLLIYFDGLKSRICVPTSLRGRLLEICHDSPLGSHTGARKLKYEMMPHFFWPQMSSHIHKYVASCEYCQRNKSYNSSTRGIPQPHTIPLRRFDVISVDLLWAFRLVSGGRHPWSLGVNWVHYVNVSFVEKISMSVTTLWFGVNSLLLSTFKLMNGFEPNMFDFVRVVTPSSKRMLHNWSQLVRVYYL